MFGGAWRRIWFLITLAIVNSQFCGSNHALAQVGEVAEGTFGPDDFRIIELTLRGRTLLAEDLFAYETSADVWLPLTELFAALEFPVSVSTDTQTIDGWFVREHQEVSIDLALGEGMIANATIVFDPNQIAYDAGEAFAPSRAR